MPGPRMGVVEQVPSADSQELVSERLRLREHGASVEGEASGKVEQLCAHLVTAFQVLNSCSLSPFFVKH